VSLLQDTTEHKCKRCKYRYHNTIDTPTGIQITCRSCGLIENILVQRQARTTVTETISVPEPIIERADFSIDKLNMITAPRNYNDGKGMYTRPDYGQFVCAYVTADQNHVRFPANLFNISALLEAGISAKHLSGNIGKRFVADLAHRLLTLERRRLAFERCERLKLQKGMEHRTLGGATLKIPAGEWTNVHSAKDKPFYYQQKAGIELCLQVGRAGLAYEQRTGKTLLMIAVIKEMILLGAIDAVLIIAPVRLLRTAWQDELDDSMPGNRRIILNSEASRLEAVKFDYNVYLSSFESAAQNWAVLKELHPDPRRIMVVMDETVKIKNPKAKRTLGCLGISLEVDYCYWLSGAPVSRLHEDIWTQAFVIDPGIFGDHYDAFSASFFYEGRGGRRAFVRSRKQVFHDLSSTFMSRCTRGEAEQFTGRDTYTVNIKLKADPAQAAVYKNMLLSFMAVLKLESGVELDSEAQNVLVQLLRLREICGGFFSFEVEPGVFGRQRLPGNPKSDWLRGYIDEHPGGQAIIFCEFDEEERIIADLLDELGQSWGGQLRADRERRGVYKERVYLNKEDLFSDHVREFQAGERTFFVGKHSSIGHGLTLSAADSAIFWNMGFNSDNYDQARMRPVAGGQCALIYHLMIDGSLETEHIYPTLRGRGDMKATVLKDAARQGYYSFFDEMSKAVLQIAAATKYDKDPLEAEARKITGYDGPLEFEEIQRYLRGDSPILNRLDMVRSAGSVANAWKRIISIYNPERERNVGVPEAMFVCAAAKECSTSGGTWEEFMTLVRIKFDIPEVGESLLELKQHNMFDMMLAYLRMKSTPEGIAV